MHIQGYWACSGQYSDMFRHTEGLQDILSHIQALLWHIESCSGIFRNLCNPCIYNLAIFRTLAYLEPEASSKTCRPCKMIRHIPNLDIVTIVYSSIFYSRYLGIFGDIDALSATLRCYSFCKMLHLKCLTVFWIRLCLDKCCVI